MFIIQYKDLKFFLNIVQSKMKRLAMNIKWEEREEMIHSLLFDVSHHLTGRGFNGDLVSQGINTGTPRTSSSTLKLS